eukprot:85204-Prymnesium_polylepis.1
MPGAHAWRLERSVPGDEPRGLALLGEEPKADVHTAAAVSALHEAQLLIKPARVAVDANVGSLCCRLLLAHVRHAVKAWRPDPQLFIAAAAHELFGYCAHE